MATVETSVDGAEPSGSAPDAAPQKGHPRGLYILFFTEMWERFSYYGMRALLLPYMISASFGWQPQAATGVYKWYTSLVYLAPLLGGLIADRLLGLRNAVFIGAVLMAVGHFLMAFPAKPIFFVALAFLIAGNGFFKPNISTIVGKMYKPGDGRRDRAFTIFYMGINIGAFLASIICPLLGEKIGFHWGFGAAGVGMVIGLIVFLGGQSRVVKDVEAVGNTAGRAAKAPGAEAKSEAKPSATGDEADKALPSAGGLAGIVGKIYPFVMMAAGPLIVAVYVRKVVVGEAKPILLIMPIAFGAIFITMGILLTRLRGAQKDKSVSIFIMFLFPVLFWLAFEQAGSALNLWAVFNTDRYVDAIKWEYPAGWWQSANALLIFVLAPLFTVLWTRLARAGKEPSTPAKMFWAMVLLVISFVVMVFGAMTENRTETRVALSAVPAGTPLAEVNAGRLTFDGGKKELVVRGVFAEFAVREAIEKSTDADFMKELKEFEKASGNATEAAPVTKTFKAKRFAFTEDEKSLKEMELKKADDGSYDGKKLGIKVKPAAEGVEVEIVARTTLDAQPRAEVLAAVAEPEWKKALKELEKASAKAKVSAFWLFLSYLFATLGELCLSPVGLSMVTKLAPARFASLFMGVWLLASSVAQYAGGSIGESFLGVITPTSYYSIFVGSSLFGVLLVLALLFPLKKLMHEVK
ncbi:MAG: peptide MFS transporter [Myxococcales bacterium]|nr:peptide MFS transporter [Myxococcales bacterium]